MLATKNLRLVPWILALTLAPLTASAADASHGEKLWKKCRSCHVLDESGKRKTGPTLSDIIGRPAGATGGYRYSKALAAAGKDGLVWTKESLDAFLEEPKVFLKGTKMTFRGMKKPEDRADLIAFLETAAMTPTLQDAHADPELPAEILAVEGDPDYGEYLSGTCTTCHQLSGGDEGIPAITGWTREDFMTAMFAYKNKNRENPVMQQITTPLSTEEIASLALYFESIENTE